MAAETVGQSKKSQILNVKLRIPLHFAGQGAWQPHGDLSAISIPVPPRNTRQFRAEARGQGAVRGDPGAEHLLRRPEERPDPLQGAPAVDPGGRPAGGGDGLHAEDDRRGRGGHAPAAHPDDPRPERLGPAPAGAARPPGGPGQGHRRQGAPLRHRVGAARHVQHAEHALLRGHLLHRADPAPPHPVLDHHAAGLLLGGEPALGTGVGSRHTVSAQPSYLPNYHNNFVVNLRVLNSRFLD